MQHDGARKFRYLSVDESQVLDKHAASLVTCSFTEPIKCPLKVRLILGPPSWQSNKLCNLKKEERSDTDPGHKSSACITGPGTLSSLAMTMTQVRPLDGLVTWAASDRGWFWSTEFLLCRSVYDYPFMMPQKLVGRI